MFSVVGRQRREKKRKEKKTSIGCWFIEPFEAWGEVERKCRL